MNELCYINKNDNIHSTTVIDIRTGLHIIENHDFFFFFTANRRLAFV